MAFAPKAGCPMCSIVASALHNSSPPPGSKQPEILWRDDNFTVYRERANPVSSKGHLVVVFNLHVPSLYNLSTADLPLLAIVRDLSRRLLSSLLPQPESTSINIEPHSAATPTSSGQFLPQQQSSSSAHKVNFEVFKIGFITPPFRDNKIPVTDHLHAHAYVLPADMMGWWRSLGFSSVAWYAIDDLIAEIREESSNNRIRSGNPDQKRPRPIDLVPNAGARTGTANGIETTRPGLATEDVEDPEMYPRRPLRQTASTPPVSPRPPETVPLSSNPAWGESSVTLTADTRPSSADSEDGASSRA